MLAGPPKSVQSSRLWGRDLAPPSVKYHYYMSAPSMNQDSLIHFQEGSLSPLLAGRGELQVEDEETGADGWSEEAPCP